jgi:hypothetical protein
MASVMISYDASDAPDLLLPIAYGLPLDSRQIGRCDRALGRWAFRQVRAISV